MLGIVNSSAEYQTHIGMKEKTHKLFFSWLPCMTSEFSCGCVSPTTTTTTESRNMATIIHIIGCRDSRSYRLEFFRPLSL